MSGSVALDVVIGLIFIILLYSLLASVLNEIVSVWIGLRSRVLKKGIVRMLNKSDDSSNFFTRIRDTFIKRDPKDGTLAKKFYEQPLIKFLGEEDKSKPAYISSDNFSKVVIDLLTYKDKKPDDNIALQIEEFLSGKNSLGISVDEETLQLFRSLWADSKGDVLKFRKLLEKWFDDTMQRASGWYKKYTQVFLFIIGLGIAIAFNVDTIQIANKLSSDPKLREQVVNQASDFMEQHPDLPGELNKAKAIPDSTDNDKEKTVDSVAHLIQIQDSLTKRANDLIEGDIKNVKEVIGLGYSKDDACLKTTFCTKAGWIRMAGWIITALAISLGAPFWFDLLNKLMQLRGAVKATSSDDDKKK